MKSDKNSIIESRLKYYPVIFLALTIISLVYIFFTTNICYKNTLNPVYYLKNHDFSNTGPLISRVKSAPDIVLDHIKNMDKRDDYRPYLPDEKELKIIENCLNNLPPLSERMIRGRLIAIYFVENFLGSGLTEWVIDSHNMFFAYMIFNPRVLKQNMTDLLTWKENTCFKQDNGPYRIVCAATRDQNGFLYILLHESTHLVDYTMNITPYVDEGQKKILDNVKESTPFTKGIWKKYDTSCGTYSFREKVTFYGFNGGPKMIKSDSPDIYSAMAKSPFPTLYGSMNWAEDLAEMVAFYHLTEVLKEKFTITITKNNKQIISIEPMTDIQIRSRLGSLDLFYK